MQLAGVRVSFRLTKQTDPLVTAPCCIVDESASTVARGVGDTKSQTYYITVERERPLGLLTITLESGQYFPSEFMLWELCLWRLC